jgi:elongation factor P
MNPSNFDQIQIPRTLIGTCERFLDPGMQIPVEFFGDQPISIVFPDIVEARVANTAPAAHAQQDSTFKEARLANGLAIRVPLFIASGELIRVDVRNLRYVERAKAGRK